MISLKLHRIFRPHAVLGSIERGPGYSIESMTTRVQVCPTLHVPLMVASTNSLTSVYRVYMSQFHRSPQQDSAGAIISEERS
ncbi:hypothetical protein BDW60DRAFT_175886 [Aspergillus nidulans var. acristatus]